MALAISAPMNTYLHDRHFAMAMCAAAFMHLMAITVWALTPTPRVVEIPVRTLNIKLGESEDMEPQAPSSSFAIEQEIITALNSAVAAAPKAPVAEETTPRQEVKESKPAPVHTQAQTVKHFVREQKFDYGPLAKRIKIPDDAPKGTPLGNSTNAKAEAIRRYEQMISLWLGSKWFYPEDARRRGETGTVVVRVHMDRRGNVRYLDIAGTSGYKALDDAALKMVKDANPFPPVPADYKPEKELVGFRLPTTFELTANKKP